MPLKCLRTTEQTYRPCRAFERCAILVCSEARDSLPEWSKGVDSSSTSASCVGSYPTAVIYQFAGETIM